MKSHFHKSPTVRTSGEYSNKYDRPDKYQQPCDYYNEAYHRSNADTYGQNEKT